MKKWLMAFLILIVLLVASAYIFIPNLLVVSNVIRLGTSQKAMTRWFAQPNTWDKIFSANGETLNKNGNSIVEDNFSISPNSPIANTAIVQLSANGDTINSQLLFLGQGKDSVAMNWFCTLPVSNNPFQRVAQYWKARQIKNIFTTGLAGVKNLIADEKNISGLAIKREIVADTFFISQKAVFTSNPTPAQIYTLLNGLRQYATKQNAEQNAPPMLHVDNIDSTHFEAMTALPINKMLPDAGDIHFKRMVRGLILTIEVKGGPWQIQHTFDRLKDYIDDHGLTEIALPFQSLITDRLQQPDSSKWVTKLYYPVF